MVTVTVNDHLVQAVAGDTLAAMGRGHLASARMTLGRRVMAGRGEQSRLTVLGQSVPLGTAAARAAGERMAMSLLSPMDTATYGAPGRGLGLSSPAGMQPGAAPAPGGFGGGWNQGLPGTNFLLAQGDGDPGEARPGRRFTVCLVHQFGSRKEAEYNEERIKSALAKGPVNVEAMIDNFNRISMMIRPEKTFSQLRKEEEAFISEMSRVFHFSTALVWNPGGVPATACGFAGGPINGGEIGYYSTNSWESLIQQAREEDALAAVGGSPKDREVCRRCLALAPLNSPVAGP